MVDQISISLPEDTPIPDKVEVKVSESNKPERIVTIFTVTSEPTIVCEDPKTDSE